MDDTFDNYYFDDGMEDNTNISFPYPEDMSLTSWDGAIATSDDWLDTMLFIRGIK